MPSSPSPIRSPRMMLCLCICLGWYLPSGRLPPLLVMAKSSTDEWFCWITRSVTPPLESRLPGWFGGRRLRAGMIKHDGTRSLGWRRQGRNGCSLPSYNTFDDYPTTQSKWRDKEGVATPLDEVLWRSVRSMETIRSPLA